MDKIVVLKCGGSILDNISAEFFQSIHALKKANFSPVIVHGGGPAIAAMLEKLKFESDFVDGLRVTTGEMIEIVEMVLSGSVNKEITRRFNDEALPDIGLSGSDAKLIIEEADNVGR